MFMESLVLLLRKFHAIVTSRQTIQNIPNSKIKTRQISAWIHCKKLFFSKIIGKIWQRFQVKPVKTVSIVQEVGLNRTNMWIACKNKLLCVYGIGQFLKNKIFAREIRLTPVSLRVSYCVVLVFFNFIAIDLKNAAPPANGFFGMIYTL